MIGPSLAVDAIVSHTRSDHSQPGGNDLRLEVAVVPGELRVYGDPGGRGWAAGGAGGAKEVIGVGK